MVDLRDFAWWPVNALYGAATAARRQLYRAGVFKSKRAPVPVISVGNISAGGTGKTPLVIWLAAALSQGGRKICVLTRGYGRPNPEERLLVSDGETVFHDAGKAGDEAVLLAESLRGKSAVVCAADRAEAAQWAVEHLGTELIILDDGFQHFALDRDADLVIIDASRPFVGLQREGLGALRRAAAIVVARTELATDLPELMRQLEAVSNGRPIFTAQTEPAGYRMLNSSEACERPPTKLPVGAFCGIGNPESFFAGLEQEGFGLVFRSALRDHAQYSQSLLDKITREAETAGAQALLTTAKDEVKLRSLTSELPIYVLETTLAIDQADRLLQIVRKSITTQAN